MARQTTVRLPEDLADEAETVARVQGTSLNQLIVESLADAINRVRADKDFTTRAERLLERDQRDTRPSRQVTRYIGLAEYMWLAEQVTGIDTATLIKASRVELADSALHAPAAGSGDDDFYPDIYEGSRAHLPPGVEPSAVRRQQTRRLGVAPDVRRPQRWTLRPRTRPTPIRRSRRCSL